MKQKSLTNIAGCLTFLMLMSIVFTQPAFAICVQSEPTEAEVVLSVDANNGCTSINDHFGCTVSKFNKQGFGKCTYQNMDGGFTVNAWIDLITGGLTWDVVQLNSEAPVGVDVTVVGGGFQGNNCGYSYAYDLFGSLVQLPDGTYSSGGSGGDCKVQNADGTCATFQNVTSLDVCTDLESDLAPPPPTVPPEAVVLENCQPDSNITGELDETGIICPTYDDPSDPATFGMQKRVIVCNLEVDKYAFGTIGANEQGATEDVCCKCGIEGDTACFISAEKATNLSEDGKTDLDTGCIVETTSDPTQEVILQFQKDRGSDPCEKIRSGGKVYKTCW